MKSLDLPPEGIYSAQQLSTRMMQLDLAVENLALMVRKLYTESQADHAHIQQIDAMLLDLQGQIRACVAQHKSGDVEGVPV